MRSVSNTVLHRTRDRGRHPSRADRLRRLRDAEPGAYDEALALFPSDVTGFLKESQPARWEALEALLGSPSRPSAPRLRRPRRGRAALLPPVSPGKGRPPPPAVARPAGGTCGRATLPAGESRHGRRRIGFGSAAWYQWGMSEMARNPAFREGAAPRSHRRSCAGEQPRRARAAAILLATGMCLASGRAVTHDSTCAAASASTGREKRFSPTRIGPARFRRRSTADELLSPRHAAAIRGNGGCS